MKDQMALYLLKIQFTLAVKRCVIIGLRMTATTNVSLGLSQKEQLRLHVIIHHSTLKIVDTNTKA